MSNSSTSCESGLETFRVGCSVLSHVGGRSRKWFDGCNVVKNPVCNTPKASSVCAGGVERVTHEVENQIRIFRSWSEGVSVDLD